MQSRLFDLLENIAAYGPITLDALAERSGFSRSATFRGLKTLQNGGWVRLRLNGREYVLTSKVEAKLCAKVEPRPEIEKLTQFLKTCIDFRTFQTHIFQQRTTSKAELVDDSVYGTGDQTLVSDCCDFLLRVMQYARVSVGTDRFDDAQRTKADALLNKLKRCSFVRLSEHRFLWIPIFSKSADVFFICLSSRDCRQVEGAIGNKLLKQIYLSEHLGDLRTFQDIQVRAPKD